MLKNKNYAFKNNRKAITCHANNKNKDKMKKQRRYTNFIM